MAGRRAGAAAAGHGPGPPRQRPTYGRPSLSSAAAPPPPGAGGPAPLVAAVNVQLPADARPGQALMVAHQGRQYQLRVPDGARPGQVLTFRPDLSVPTPA